MIWWTKLSAACFALMEQNIFIIFILSISSKIFIEIPIKLKHHPGEEVENLHTTHQRKSSEKTKCSSNGGYNGLKVGPDIQSNSIKCWGVNVDLHNLQLSTRIGTHTLPLDFAISKIILIRPSIITIIITWNFYKILSIAK